MSEPQDNYQSWMSRMLGDRDSKPLEAGEVVQSSAPEPFGVIEFATVHREKYKAEIGKKNGDYIYHFFPKNDDVTLFPPSFADKMGDAFLQVFAFEDRVEASYSIELNSWAVRAVGFAHNPMADTMALSLFDVLDKNLE